MKPILFVFLCLNLLILPNVGLAQLEQVEIFDNPITLLYPHEVVALPAKKNVSGIYVGTFVAIKTKAFNGASCTETPSYNAGFSITHKKKKSKIFVIPASGTTLNGKVKKKGFRASAKLSDRKFVLSSKKVKANSAVFKIVETISVGKLKACVFAHKGTFTRTP